MGSWGQRSGAKWLALALALAAATGCSGAASTPLDVPAPPSQSGSSSGDMSHNDHDATTGSSSGGGRHMEDATVSDEASLDDATVDMSDASEDSGSNSPHEAGPPDASSMCGAGCPFGNRCCTTPGALSYGQCYAVNCGICCF
jgi:hypothetical protein